jgi:mono/diheme cytochrome c family protein
VRTLIACLALAGGTLGCWEQWSNEWWPQMKWQPTVPVDDDAAANALANPRPMSFASIENGREQYGIFCATCHGLDGRGDGPVSMTGDVQGPIAAVLPIAGPGSIARVRSDGHIYVTIRHGRRRMPSYTRIPSADRWDIVNYVRYLNDQRGASQ